MDDTFYCDFCCKHKPEEERQNINIKYFSEDEFEADCICKECRGEDDLSDNEKYGVNTESLGGAYE